MNPLKTPLPPPRLQNGEETGHKPPHAAMGKRWREWRNVPLRTPEATVPSPPFEAKSKSIKHLFRGFTTHKFVSLFTRRSSTAWGPHPPRREHNTRRVLLCCCLAFAIKDAASLERWAKKPKTEIRFRRCCQHEHRLATTSDWFVRRAKQTNRQKQAKTKKQIGKETDRETDKETDMRRNTDKQRNRQAERERQTTKQTQKQNETETKKQTNNETDRRN